MKMKKEEKIEEVKSPIDCLFDEDDTSPISLFDEKGEEVKFEQIALIPLKEKIYAILKPINKMEFIGDDEALVFEVVQKENEKDGSVEEFLNLVSDIDTIDKAFVEYNKLVDQEEVKQKTSGKKEGKK
ncbi:MAG: DUF1292 domain-containing protein [Clostridia bacterium]|nr:DUF1292 domain-containing protein [Clostridia bacterium]